MLGVKIIPFDLASSGPDLVALFRRFRTVINCTGFVGGPGTPLRITNAALDAGIRRFFPWQFGVDYDIVGKGSGQPVFDEQYEVRQLLRAQDRTEWVIVSTGMFTSKFQRTEWTLDKLNADLADAPEDVMTRYRAGFGLGDGMWWDKASTYNAHKGIVTHDVEAWLRAKLVETAA